MAVSDGNGQGILDVCVQILRDPSSSGDSLVIEALGELHLLENQPAGTLVGEFAADGSASATFDFSLVRVEDWTVQEIEARISELEALSQDLTKSPGDLESYGQEIDDLSQKLAILGSQDLFAVEPSGVLRNLSVFDFESDPSEYLIRVRVVDDRGVSRERDFTIQLIDLPDSTEPEGPTGPGDPSAEELIIHSPVFVSVPENEAFVIGLYATGPLDAVISFSIIDGADQSHFQINEATGGLHFLTVPDFETAGDADGDNLYEVTIEARAGDAAVTHDLKVEVLDADEDHAGPIDPSEPGGPESPGEILLPVVRTEFGRILEFGEIELSGRILFDGGEEAEEVGFLLSPSLRIDPESPQTLRMPVSDREGESFALRLPQSPYAERLYLQAYAVNSAGMTVGARKRIKIPEPSSPWWGKTDSLPGGWLSSSWFGSFKSYERGWLFHSSLHWLYSSPSEDGGIWLWKEGTGWLWTREGIWPYLWSHAHGNWIYLPPEGQGLLFYDYANQSYQRF